MIHIIRTRATPNQVQEMLEVLTTYIKLAVDIQRAFWRAAVRCTLIVSQPC